MRKNITYLIWGLLATGIITPALALDESLGIGGINARLLQEAPYNLTGRKIAIGQVEIGRPGKYGFDKAVSWNPNVKLANVFAQDQPAVSDDYVDDHAGMVATVMVSQDKKIKGVAPDARLYSSAIGSMDEGGQPEECAASQYVAEQNGGDVRAINFSFGESLARDDRKDAKLDGQALLTQCIDWSAKTHDVLYVIAGNQGGGGIPIPTDHYNGITTAYTAQRDGEFKKVDFANLSDIPLGTGRSLISKEINVGLRRAITLLAPGNKILLYDITGKKVEVSGTSFAAPHITASVALLQEAGDRALYQKQPNWSINYRRHELMKAVMLNAADKIKDKGDGLLLGMKSTIVSKNNQTWLDSDAYQNPEIPLDIQMGTGQLNVFRAYQQLNAGQWSYQQPVATMGWNYDRVGVNSYQDYAIEKPLQQGSFAAVTLTWDRLVDLNDNNQNQRFDVGETFRDRGLNDLNIYLMPVDGNNTTQSVCSSVSKVDSTEHIFCPIPATGRYKIRVEYKQRLNEEQQNYALAWWTVAAK